MLDGPFCSNLLPRMRCGGQVRYLQQPELAFRSADDTRSARQSAVEPRKVVGGPATNLRGQPTIMSGQLDTRPCPLKGHCHWEYDLRSFLDFILDTQAHGRHVL